MSTGTVTTYHADLGYGTITPDDGGPDLYVYFDSVEGGTERTLIAGDRVVYDPTEQEGRPVAERVRVA